MVFENLSKLGRVTDEERGYVKGVLYVVLITALVALTALTIANFALGWQGTGVITGVTSIVCAALLWLTWKGHLAAPRLLLPLVAVTVAVYLVRRGEGLRDEAMLLFPLAIVMSGLLLGPGGLGAATALSLTAIAIQALRDE